MTSESTITVAGDGSSASMGASERPLQPGDLVGRYVVLSKVGAGGMGIVYAAYDPELDRRVALKLLHGEVAEARERRQKRLLREARAMAKLAHPNVVAIHDVGAHEEQVYIAMEFVEGETLTAWSRARPRPWQEVLEVFVAAGRGLAAAHDSGLVHRDFKPDNVMIGTGVASVRVMDFGLARTTDSTTDTATSGPQDVGRLDMTRAGSLAGTPAYMAPETLRYEPVGPAADQFSFCVALWETLYGEHPFAGETAAVLLSNVSAGRVRPPPPGRSVPRWLRRACLRGLALDPSQRFDGMHALVRALEGGPVRAWRLRGLAAVAVLAAVGAGAAAIAGQRRAQAIARCEAEGESIAAVWNEGRRTELQAAIVGSGVPDAEATVDRVTPWLDAHAEQWADARADACLRTEVEQVWDEERFDRSVWCLDDRKRALDALLATMGRREPAAVHRVVEAAAALTPVEPCLDEHVLQRQPAPPRQERDAVAAVRDELSRATALHNAAAYDEALDAARGALAQAEELHSTALVGECRFRVGEVLEEKGAFAEAERALEDAYFEAVEGGASELAIDSARALAFLVAYRFSRFADAMRWWRQSDVLDRQLPDPNGLRRGQSLARLAMVHRAAGEYAKAEEAGLRAVALLEGALGPDHPGVARVLTGLGLDSAHVRRLDAAREYFERALAIQEGAFGPDHMAVAYVLDNLGTTLSDLGLRSESFAARERSLRIRERVLGRDHPDVATSLSLLANEYRDTGDHERAREMIERALAIQEKTLGPDDLDVARTLTYLANIHHVRGDAVAARPLLERAVRIAEATLGPEHPELAYPLGALAGVLVELGEIAAARGLFERVGQLIERGASAEHPQLVDVYEPLAEIAMQEGRAADAVANAERAAAVAEAAALEPTRVAAIRFTLARAVALEGSDPVRAQELAQLAREAYAAAGDRAKEVAEIDAWLAR